MLLNRKNAVLVVIDVQERLLPAIHDSERTVAQIVRAVRGFSIAGAPVLATEQYRKGLGPTQGSIAEAVATAGSNTKSVAGSSGTAFAPIEKMTFSCAAHDPFMDALEELDRKQVVVCGIEAHVCVVQTALQLSAGGFDTYVLADAISSRSPHNVEIALRRMERAGVHPSSVEMAVFEMLHECGTSEFKEWVSVIR